MIINKIIYAISPWTNCVRVLWSSFVLIETFYCRSEKLKSLRNFSGFKRSLLFWVIVSTRSRHSLIVFIFKNINVSIKSSSYSCVRTLANCLGWSTLHYSISWLYPFNSITKWFVSVINNILRLSLNLRSEHTLRLLGIDDQSLRDIVLPWTWKLWLFRSFSNSCCFGFQNWFPPLDYTYSILTGYIFRIIDFIITWTYTVKCNSWKSNLIRLLLNKLPHHIFFISKNAKMTWYGRRIQNPNSVFAFSLFKCQSCLRLNILLVILLVLSRSWLTTLFPE